MPYHVTMMTRREIRSHNPAEPCHVKVTVIVPAYNEAATLEAILERLESRDDVDEVLVVDDGSTDGTSAIVLRFTERDTRFRLLRHPTNLGKGAAVRTALAQATGDVFIIQDADLEYDPVDFPKLLSPIRQGKADVVYGSRIRGRNPMSYLSFFLGGVTLSILTDLLYAARITDEPTCYKAFRREALSRIELRANGFEFCPELTAKLLLSGRRIHEVAISYVPRTKDQGKKIRWTDGLKAVWTLFFLRLTGKVR
ncbi:MAG: glycosyltransferase family 2 protein [Planctomycetota bacterium]